MNYEMRRHAQQLSESETYRILERNHTAVLALSGEDGFPYAVPVNYALSDGKLLIHGARTGKKYDTLLRDGHVSLCVIDHSEPVPEELATRYRSVIVFATARELQGVELQSAAEKFGLRFYHNLTFIREDIQKELSALSVFELSIISLTGKRSKIPPAD